METRTYDYIMVQLASGEEQMWGGGENKVKALLVSLLVVVV